MSTKVKGDKIKEGSIPLSALSNEVKDKIENAGGGADWNAQKGEAGYIENKPNIDPVVWKYLCNPYLIVNDIYVDDNSSLEAIRIAIKNNAFGCVKVAFDDTICQVLNISEISNSHWVISIYTGSTHMNVDAEIIPEDADYKWKVYSA